jgi:DNA-directed RNA polymerase subunit RPC12/RpoP
MKLEKTIITYATEEAKKKWEGKKQPVKNRKINCPSCEIKILPQIIEEDIKE